MVRGMNFVFTGLQSWNAALPGNAMRLAAEISAHNDVLYVNPPQDFFSLFRGDQSTDSDRRVRVLRGLDPALRRLNRHLWILEPPIITTPTTGILSERFFDAVNRWNNRKFWRTIEWAMTHIHMEHDHLIHINDNDVYGSFYLKEWLLPLLSLYYRRANLTSFAYWERHGGRLEPRLVRNSDAVLTNSEPIAAGVRPYNYKTFNVGQGADLSHLRQCISELQSSDNKYNNRDVEQEQNLPNDLWRAPNCKPDGIQHGESRPDFRRSLSTCAAKELSALRRPMIGYVGNVGALYLSPQLVYKLAVERPNYTFVLVGPEDAYFARHPLHALSNVYFFGPRSHEELLAYMDQFDVCIHPLAVNDVTMNDYNGRVDEYLSFGKPVVATCTRPMEVYYQYIHLAHHSDEFLHLLDRALEERADPVKYRERQEFALLHDWTRCVGRVYDVIELLLEERLEAAGFPKVPSTYS